MAQTPQLPFPLQFLRQYAGSLDADFEFATTAERIAYLSSPRAYAGMIVYDGQEDALYYIDADKAYQPLKGSGTPLQHTLTVSGNGQTEFDLSALVVDRKPLKLDSVRYYGIVWTPEEVTLDGTTLRVLITRYALEAGEKIIINYYN